MVLGVIGGSGLYSLDRETKNGAKGGTFESVTTPYGDPSGKIFRLATPTHTLLFLPRHGVGHIYLPSEVPYLANIYAFKKLGAEIVVSISAVGSLRKEIEPGDFVLPDQYIDRTHGRPSTFFGRGVVAHSHFADPCCSTLRAHLASIAESLNAKMHLGGTYVCMEGPQFSTRAESHWHRSWDSPHNKVSIIGMTALPEAKLAREAGLCYQTIATATDYDCWNEEHEDVTIEAILRTLKQNAEMSQNLIRALANGPIPRCTMGCREMTKNAVVTPKELWPKEREEEINTLLG